jgi:hypothetical protein
MPDRPYLGGHVGLPQRIGVVEDGGELDVLARIDGGTRRRADAGGRLMIDESDAVLLDPLAARRRHRPCVEEVLLIDQDEQDVIAARRRCGGDHRCRARHLLCGGGNLRSHRGGGPERGCAAGHHRTAGRIASSSWRSRHRCLPAFAQWGRLVGESNHGAATGLECAATSRGMMARALSLQTFSRTTLPIAARSIKSPAVAESS